MQLLALLSHSNRVACYIPGPDPKISSSEGNFLYRRILQRVSKILVDPKMLTDRNARSPVAHMQLDG